MKKISFLLFTAFLFAIFPLKAQITELASNNNNQIANEAPYIEVVGTAELNVEPDEIYIKILLFEDSDNPIEKQEQNLKTALQNIGIDIKNLTISDAVANLKSSIFKGKEVINQKEYILKVNSATLVTKVFTELDKLKIRNAFIHRVSHSKIDSLRKEVRIMAIKAAKEKANYLLFAIGEKCGKALIIKEENSFDEVNYSNFINRVNNYKYKTEGWLSESDKAQNEISYKKIVIQYFIYAKFQIQ
jgi:hypothetical protein